MSEPALIARLREHAALGDAPEAELEWLAANGELVRFPEDEVVARPGESIDHLYVMLSGHVAHHLERSYGLRKVMEWHGGDVTGLLPYSRLSATTGTTAAVEATEVVALSRERLKELPTACPEITATLVHVMLDRARHFTSADLNDRKALALGKVAAGLAHELNNPASALVRSAKTLAETLAAGPNDPGARFRAQSPEALAAVSELYDACKERPPAGWDPITLADREDAIEAWLREADEEPNLAGVLAESPLELDELFGLADRVTEPGAAAAAACHMARALHTERLAEEIKDGAARIFHLVDAVKRFTHMDQTMVMEPVDLDAGLRDAVTMLAEKARNAGVTVTVDLAPDLPRVTGVVEELNQMWHALLDNAVDAAAPDGTVGVAGGTDRDQVWIEVRDSGPGIPDEIRDRIFDPFFTTKPVGQGAGLGLELVRRVVDQHRGELDVTSGPGGATFRIALPV